MKDILSKERDHLIQVEPRCAALRSELEATRAGFHHLLDWLDRPAGARRAHPVPGRSGRCSFT